MNIILEYHDIFTLPGDSLPLTDLIQHEIETSDPIRTKQYRYSPIHQEEIKMQIKEMLAKVIIRESDSPYNSSLWIIIDFRKLNEKTIQDVYLLPNIAEILDHLGNARYFLAFEHQDSIK